MKTHLLFLTPIAGLLKKALEPMFPQLSIHTAAKEEEIGDLIEDVDVLMAFEISDELIKKASRLKWIQLMTAGADHIAMSSIRREVLITTSRGVHAPQMSEMAILFMLALGRNLPKVIRNQDLRIWESWPGRLLHRRKVGILGVGAIGTEIARKCKAFGMTVFGIDMIKKDLDIVDHFYGPEDLIQVISEVDYFVIAAPATPQTQKMIGPKELSHMKPTAFLINIGRGAIVDEEALIHVLETKQIAGAGLDTFCIEPLPKDNPLWGMQNVIISSHMGGMGDMFVKQVLPLLEENLRRFLQGERRNLVNLVER